MQGYDFETAEKFIPGLVVIIVFESQVATIDFLNSSYVTLRSARNKTSIEKINKSKQYQNQYMVSIC